MHDSRNTTTCIPFNVTQQKKVHYQKSERFLRIVYMFGDYPSTSAPL